LSARHKLNTTCICGALLVAAILGGMFQSWAAFLLATVLLIAAAFYCDGIRPGRPRRR
jgi:hypothetical protein